MKIFLTGATGFIGSHVRRELNARSLETIAVSRRIKHQMPAIMHGQWIKFDIREAGKQTFPEPCPRDVLIHLAWQGLPQYGSLHHFEKELPTHYAFLKQMASLGMRNIVVAGTCFEYGMQTGALDENMANRPSNPYGFAKDVLRRQLEFLQERFSFNLTWARLFYVYGKGQASSALMSQLEGAVSRGEKRFNMSGGEQLRDYLPAERVARYLVDLALLQKDVGVVNVCSGTPVSVRSLIEKRIQEKHWQIDLNLGYYPYSPFEPMAFWGNTAKLLSMV